MRQTCLNCIYELAGIDDRVVFIGSDLGYGVLEKFKINYPDRFFMEGVAEQHIVGMATGMAMVRVIWMYKSFDPSGCIDLVLDLIWIGF